MNKTATNEHTGAKLVSKPASDNYRANYDRIFIRNNDAPFPLKPVAQAAKAYARAYQRRPEKLPD